VDDVTREYCKGCWAASRISADPDAEYDAVVDTTFCMRPVSKPHQPENAAPIDDERGLPVDQSKNGSCTNGRISDMLAAAEVLRGRKVHRTYGISSSPATSSCLDMLREGLMQRLSKRAPPSARRVRNVHRGTWHPGAGERAGSTTNRNFVGAWGTSNLRFISQARPWPPPAR
jgi:3-isopropylmalate/(R)-2-methylmalate dehydratase large subunit